MAEAPSSVEVEKYFVVIFQDGGGGELQSLTREVVRQIQDRLDEHLTTAPEATEIDVWLESPGGDAHAAYKLFLELNARCRWLRVVIPDYAKSEATLFALGADEIWMAAAAELGPIDAQIFHPDREGVMVSALDVSKALGFLGSFALDYLVQAGAQVLEATELPRADVLNAMARFSARIVEPIIAKLDPHLIHKAANELDVAQKYAGRMLEHRHEKARDAQSDDDDDEEAVREQKVEPSRLTEHLCKSFPSHGFVISRGDCKELGLPIKPLEAYDYQAELSALYRLYREHHHPIIRAWPEHFIVTLTEHLVDTEDEPSDEDDDDETQQSPKATEGGSEPPPEVS